MGNWTGLTRQPGSNSPSFGAGQMLLLTDGTVMVQKGGGRSWFRLMPDKSGSYINGTWSQLADMSIDRTYFASAVLADGRVFVAGGEFSSAGDDTNSVEIY